MKLPVTLRHGVVIAFGMLLAGSAAQALAEASLTDAVEQAHSKLFSSYVDKHGLILDFVG